MICMICHETPERLNKICICNESLVCNDCLKILNSENTNFCPICRSVLRVEVGHDRNKFLKKIAFNIFLLILLFFVELYPVISNINNYNNNTDLIYNKDFQYFITYFNILIIQPLTLLYILNFFKNRELSYCLNKDGKLYLTILLIMNLVYDIILYSIDIGDKFFVYYFAGVLIPFYLIPFGIMVIKLFYEFIENWHDIILKNSIRTQIQCIETSFI